MRSQLYGCFLGIGVSPVSSKSRWIWSGDNLTDKQQKSMGPRKRANDSWEQENVDERNFMLS